MPKPYIDPIVLILCDGEATDWMILWHNATDQEILDWAFAHATRLEPEEGDGPPVWTVALRWSTSTAIDRANKLRGDDIPAHSAADDMRPDDKDDAPLLARQDLLNAALGLRLDETAKAAKAAEERVADTP